MDLSSRGWGRVIVVTVAGVLGCIAAAVYVDSFTFASMSGAAMTRAILVDTLLPLGLAGPLLGFLMTKLRELAIAHHDLSIVASTDSLTAVLNRGAFKLLVDAYLGKVAEQQALGHGALLVVDADNFKTINDRFGHDRGDVALKLIAQSIQSALRGADLVGRIGGEEFGVFLPGSTAIDAGAIAERIRAAVAAADFRPEGTVREPLSVSVGGASFEQHVQFDALFRVADNQLYDAKRRGRNRVALGSMLAA